MAEGDDSGTEVRLAALEERVRRMTAGLMANLEECPGPASPLEADPPPAPAG